MGPTMTHAVDIKLDTYAYAQLKVLRRYWHKLKPDHHCLLARIAHGLIRSESPAAPLRRLALPENCSPKAMAAFREMTGYWPAMSHDHRVEILDSAVKLAGGSDDQ